MRGEYRIKGNIRCPITAAEVAAKCASLQVGDCLVLPVMQYNDDNTEVGRLPERCVVETVSRHLIVCRRRCGLTESRTYVELCMMDRGMRV